MDKYNKQGKSSILLINVGTILKRTHSALAVMMETQHYKLWASSGPEKVKEEAVKRLQAGGWDAVRPAINNTIRYASPSAQLLIVSDGA